MKQQPNKSNRLTVRMAAIVVGAALLLTAGAFYVSSASQSKDSAKLSGYGIECNTPVPAIIPGMMHSLLNIEF